MCFHILIIINAKFELNSSSRSVIYEGNLHTLIHGIKAIQLLTRAKLTRT